MYNGFNVVTPVWDQLEALLCGLMRMPRSLSLKVVKLAVPLQGVRSETQADATEVQNVYLALPPSAHIPG